MKCKVIHLRPNAILRVRLYHYKRTTKRT